MSEEISMTQAELAEYDAETVRLVMEAERRAKDAECEHEDTKAEVAHCKKRYKLAVDALRALIRDREEQRGKRPEATLLDQIPQPSKWRSVDVQELETTNYMRAFLASNGVYNLGDLHTQITTFDPAQGAPFGLSLDTVFDLKTAIQKVIDAESEEMAATPAPAQATSELWREYPIARWSVHGLTAKDIEKLEAGEVKRETGRRPIVTVGDLSEFSKPTATGYSRNYGDIKGIGPAGAGRLAEAETHFWAWWNKGGQEEFARERGLTNGAAPASGTGSEGITVVARPADEDDDNTDDPDATDLHTPAEEIAF
jgi:hypothetical protein